MNSIRATYLSMFLLNAVFATLFKSIGKEILSKFGTFDQCDDNKNPSCMGNQMIFRASFSISVFFLVRTILSKLCGTKKFKQALMILFVVELPVYLGILIGSFFIPSSFFDGYAQFARVASGFFILSQILSIVDFSYSMRDTLLDFIEKSEKRNEEDGGLVNFCAAIFWKMFFLLFSIACLGSLGAGAAYLYIFYGGCDVGIAFPTITLIFSSVLVLLSVSSWLDVGLLPPSLVSVYLILMCWQALTSNPDKNCETNTTNEDTDSRSVIYSAFLAAFSMTWTSWRTSNDGSRMLLFNQEKKNDPTAQVEQQLQFSNVALAADLDKTQPNDSKNTMTKEAEPWQFYFMMLLGGIYMSMVLTDWDSEDGVSNGVSMWVKIISQWATMLLFFWTLLAPKLFPDRDFS